MKKCFKNKVRPKGDPLTLTKKLWSYCLDSDETRWLPLKEYTFVDDDSKVVIFMDVNYRLKKVTFLHKESRRIERKGFKWCEKNLKLLREF